MRNYLGIDFGIKKCRVAVYQDDKTLVIPIKHRFHSSIDLSRLNRSFVNIDKDFLTTLKFLGIKQRIGLEERIPYENKQVRLHDLASKIFRLLKADAEDHLKREFDGAVVCVPSCFADKQRTVLNTVVEKGGFSTIKLLDEAIAATMACRINENYGNLLVYSMGEGIFDVSLIQNTNSIPRALWHEGDKKLGGQDFDILIIRHIMENLGIDYSNYSLESIYALKKYAEKLKIQLSTTDSAMEEIDILNDLKLENVRTDKRIISLERLKFEEMISDYVEYTIDKSKKAFQGVKLSYSDIDAIILTGGSTKIPLIQKRLQEEFGKEFIEASKYSLAEGAAIYSIQLPNPEKKQPDKKSVIQEASNTHSSTPPVEREKNQNTTNYKWLSMFRQNIINAELLWNNNQTDKAIEALEEVHQSLVGFIVHLYWDRGNDLLRVEKIDEAIKYFTKGYRINKEDDSIRTKLHESFREKAYLLAKQKRYIEAKKYIKEGIKLKPDCSTCRDLYSQIEAAIKKHRISVGHKSGKHRKKRR